MCTAEIPPMQKGLELGRKRKPEKLGKERKPEKLRKVSGRRGGGGEGGRGRPESSQNRTIHVQKGPEKAEQWKASAFTR